MVDKLGEKLAEFAQRSDEHNKLVSKRGTNLSAPPGIQELIDVEEAELRKLSDWLAKHHDDELVPLASDLETELALVDERRKVLIDKLISIDEDRKRVEKKQLAVWQLQKQVARYVGRKAPLKPEQSYHEQERTNKSMTHQRKVQALIGSIKWGDYSREVVAGLDPQLAGELANSLRGGIQASGIMQIDPKRGPPLEVQRVLDVLAALEARSRGIRVIEPKPEVVSPPKPKARKPRRSKK